MTINENKIASIKVHVNKLDKVTSLKEKDIKSILESIEIHYADGKVEIKKEFPRKPTKKKDKQENIYGNSIIRTKQDFIIDRDSIYTNCCYIDFTEDSFVKDNGKKKNKKIAKSISMNCCSDDVIEIKNIKSKKVQCNKFKKEISDKFLDHDFIEEFKLERHTKVFSNNILGCASTRKPVKKERAYTEEEVATIIKRMMADMYGIHVNAVGVDFEKYADCKED